MPLHPQITAALDAFRQRRRKLLLWRIFLTGAGILLTGTLLIACLDWVFFLPDTFRHALAFLLYAVLVVGLWLRGGRQLQAPSDPKTVARQMEAAAPSPHGQFLASVELALEPPAAAGDSHEFRTLLHEHSALHAAKSDPRILIPFRHLHKELALALGVSVVVCALFVTRGREFGVLCLRALAPAANLARISQFQISIVAPTPGEGEFPEGEKLIVLVEVAGPATVVPFLQTLGKNSSGTTPMRADSHGHFQAQIDLGNAPIEYRIRAGDALTRRFLIQPIARPHAISFQKTYQPPAYTSLPVRKLTEEDGNLSALEGSSVQLEVQLDQPVLSAQISFEREGIIQMLILEPSRNPRIFTCKLPVQQHATYHLELVSAATGFASRTTPQFEIRAEPDLAPTVSLETPIQDLAIPLGEKVQIRGHAEDDLGLVSFTQAIRINQGAWQEFPLMSQGAKSFDAERSWDPLLDRAKPGDLISTKLIATDARGQRSESRVVQIAVALAGTLSSASRALAIQREIHEQLQGLQRETQEAARALGEVKAQNESQSPDVIKRDQAMLAAQRALENSLQKAAAARTQLAAALANPSDPQAEKDFLQTAQLLNRIQMGFLEAARDSLQESADGASLRAEDKREALRTAAEAAAQAAHKSNLAADVTRSQLAAREAVSLSESARALAREQLALRLTPAVSDEPSTPEAPSPAERRQQVNEAAIRTLQQDLAALAERNNTAREQLKPVREDLQKTRSSIEKSLHATDLKQDNSAASRMLAESLERSGNVLANLQPALEADAAKAREAVQRESQSASQRLERLQHELEALTQRPALSPQSRNAQSALRVAAEASTLQADATLASTRPDPDTTLAPELATAARALRAAGTDNLDSKASATKAKALAEALRPLEGAAKLAQSARAADVLAENTPDSESPLPPGQRDAWKGMFAELQKLPGEVKASALPEATSAKLREALDAQNTNRVRSAIDAAANPHAPAPVREDAEVLAAGLQTVARSAANSVSEAREALNKQAPSAAEEFKRMAAIAALAGETTRKLAAPATPAAAESRPPEPAAPESSKAASVADAQKEEAKFARQVAGARDGLLQEANQQNLMSSEGREKARDADAAAALLKDAAKAGATLGQAAKTQETSAQAALLKKAAEEQTRLSKQLAQIAQAMQAQQDGSPEQAAKARAALRESEKESGVASALDGLQKRSPDLAALATA